MAANDDMATLLELVACPVCRGALRSERDELRCTGCERAFRLQERVPVLLHGADTEHTPSALARLQYAILGNPRLYDLHQAYGGGRPIAAEVGKELTNVDGGTLVDVGAGTGMVAGLVPPGTRYVWLDNDLLKLRGFLSKAIDGFAVLGDASRLPFRDDAADRTVMVDVSHHLPEAALRECFDEVARVTRDRFLFVDAVRGPRLRSKLLWQLDLGRFPRTEDELIRALEASFELEKVERFRINHDYLLCVGVPRARSETSRGR